MPVHVGTGGGPGRRASGYGRSTFGRGRIAFSRARLFNSSHRVVVKARIARQQGRAFRSAPLHAHLSYLKRDGVTRDGEKAVMFDADSDHADNAGFAARSKDDRHHFRFIISREDTGEMTDLRAFTGDLARQMEADLGTRLDWVAVDHWNTDNPHVHLLVRDVDTQGTDLVISRDYISRGLRSRAEDLVSIELGPKPEYEIKTALEREITAERWTRLDVEIRIAADETGFIDRGRRCASRCAAWRDRWRSISMTASICKAAMRNRMNVYFPPEMLRKIADLADRKRLSRSAIIESAVASFLSWARPSVTSRRTRQSSWPP